MPFNEKLPEWNNAGVEPPQSKKDEGFSPGEKPPAQWFNWLLNRIYKAIQELREKVVVKVAGKDLSSNDYTTEEKIKLGGISKQATKVESSSINGNIKIDGVNAKVYEHPSSHPAEMIEESATKKFVSTSQINNWDSKETSTGAQAKANTAEQNAKNYADTVIGSIQVPVKSVNNKTGDVTLTVADVGAETPSGAQSKANAAASAALNAANQYTDGVSGALSTQMAEYAQDFNEHISDYIRQPGYGVTAGSANSYTLTLNPSLPSYVAGVCVSVKIHVTNTGAATLNINGKGAKSIRDSKGNVLTAGKLLKDIIYTMRYDGTNFILQGEGGSGNATASDLLSGKTASVDAGDIVGTIPSKGAATITPKTTNQTIASGQYLSGTQTILGDANLIPANIIQGKSIFGVAGTAKVETFQVSGLSLGANGTYTLPFTPDIVFASGTVNHSSHSGATNKTISPMTFREYSSFGFEITGNIFKNTSKIIYSGDGGSDYYSVSALRIMAYKLL